MEFNELLAKRRSIRKFLPDQVRDDVLDRIIDAAHMAPSGANTSPWQYVIVKEPGLKHQIREASEAVDSGWNANMPPWFQSWLKSQHITSTKSFLDEAPCLLVVFSDNRFPYSVESTWISIGFALLAVTQEGLGTLTYTPADPSFLSNLLSTPEHLVPQAILPIGYAAEQPSPASRQKRRHSPHMTS